MVVVVVLLTILFHLVQPVCPVHPTLFRETERSSLTRARLITDVKDRPVDDGTRKRNLSRRARASSYRRESREQSLQDRRRRCTAPILPTFSRFLSKMSRRPSSAHLRAHRSARWPAVPLDSTPTTTLCVPVYTRIEWSPSWLLAKKNARAPWMNFSTSQDDPSRPPRRRKRAPGP